MKRNLIVVLVVLALAITGCIPQQPVRVEVTVNQNQNVNTESGCTTCTAPVAPVSPTAAPEPTPTAPTASTYSENPAIEPLQPKDWADSTNYPTIFKGQMGDVFYCGALAVDAQFPEGFKTIEEWPKVEGDGNFLHASASNEYSMAAFCSGDTPEKYFAPSGTMWTTVLLETTGFDKVTFPLLK